MDIAGMSIVLNQANLQQAVSLSVMRMTMDTAQNNGQAMLKVLEASAPKTEMRAASHLGNKIDVIW